MSKTSLRPPPWLPYVLAVVPWGVLGHVNPWLGLAGNLAQGTGWLWLLRHIFRDWRSYQASRQKIRELEVKLEDLNKYPIIDQDGNLWRMEGSRPCSKIADDLLREIQEEML